MSHPGHTQTCRCTHDDCELSTLFTCSFWEVSDPHAQEIAASEQQGTHPNAVASTNRLWLTVALDRVVVCSAQDPALSPTAQTWTSFCSPCSYWRTKVQVRNSHRADNIVREEQKMDLPCSRQDLSRVLRKSFPWSQCFMSHGQVIVKRGLHQLWNQAEVTDPRNRDLFITLRFVTDRYVIYDIIGLVFI